MVRKDKKRNTIIAWQLSPIKRLEIQVKSPGLILFLDKAEAEEHKTPLFRIRRVMLVPLD